MNQNPKVSVIITCYNQENLIEKAILSVINQTYQDWECLVIDDGSSDKSAQIIKELTSTDPKIQYIHQTNKGVAAARNNGFQNSKGQYIQFLDGDDFITPEKLETQIEYMESHSEIDVTYTNHLHYYDVRNKYIQYTFKVLPENPLDDILFGWDRGVSLPIHSALIRRNIWKENELPFFPLYTERCEDWLFWINIALKNSKFKFIDKNYAIYRMHDNNFTNSLNAYKYFLKAAVFITPKLPPDIQDKFITSTIDFCLTKHADVYIQYTIHSTTTWKLSNLITKVIRKLKPNNP